MKTYLLSLALILFFGLQVPNIVQAKAAILPPGAYRSETQSFTEFQSKHKTNKGSAHKYLEALAEAMTDCPEIALAVGRRGGGLGLSERDLMEILAKHYDCFKEKTRPRESKPSSIFKKGILTGISRAKLVYTSKSPYDIPRRGFDNALHSLAAASYKNVIAPGFGIYIDVTNSESKHGFSFRGEFYYQSFTFRGTNTFFDPNFDTEIVDEIDVSFQRFSLPLGIRKRLGGNKSPAYIMLGISPQVFVGRRYTLFRESQQPPAGGGFRPTQTIWGGNRAEIGFWSKLGINLTSIRSNSLNLEIKGEYSRRTDALSTERFSSLGRASNRNSFEVFVLSLVLAYDLAS